ncbi:MAG: MFS transporter [Verrucomicrobia bacterium]|nr:MFS transporter [Verrucomicrobiota bacterium]
MKKPSLLIIFLTVFIDLIGFGIVLPLLPIYSDQFGASGVFIGVIMASFSAMQFLFAPAWGRLSDRIGRRPVLLVSTAGAAASYALFGLGSGFADGRTVLMVILLSRVLAGVCGANITVAQACIADITPPEQRSKKMGLVGMAFGLGFIFGPALGGVSLKFFGLTGPGWVAASLCAANFLLAFFILPETRQPGSAGVSVRPRWNQWAHVLSRPNIGLLVGLFFLATFCFTCFETTLGLLVARNFKLVDPTIKVSSLDLMNRQKFHDAAAASTILFAYCGFVGAFVQGGPLGRLVKRMGEPRLIAFSLFLVAMSLAPLPFIHGDTKLSWAVLFQNGGLPWWELLGALALLAIGSGLTRPPLFGMLSILTPANEQGETIGVAQSAGSLARIFGPLFAGGLFHLHPTWPYVACALISFVAGIFAWSQLIKTEPALLAAKAHSGVTA